MTTILGRWLNFSVSFTKSIPSILGIRMSVNITSMSFSSSSFIASRPFLHSSISWILTLLRLDITAIPWRIIFSSSTINSVFIFFPRSPFLSLCRNMCCSPLNGWPSNTAGAHLLLYSTPLWTQSADQNSPRNGYVSCPAHF